MSVLIECKVCHSSFSVPPCRAKTARFCSRECHNKAWRIPGIVDIEKMGRPRVAPVERTCAECDKSFEIAPSRASEADRVGGMKGNFCSRSCASRNHQHSDEARSKMSAARKLQPVTPAMLEALRKGRTWANGQTKETHPGIAKRARTLSRLYSGTKNPEHGARMRRYYAEHPDKHPNNIMIRRGFVSKPERMMRQALADASVSARWQYRIGRFFADFAIIEARVVVEVDGLYWHDPVRDAERDAFMDHRGWRVLRFTDKQVLADLPACIAVICEEIQHSIAQTFQARLL